MMHLDGILELDVMLPSQYLRRQRAGAPEYRLMIAVVHDALDCIVKHRFARDRQRRRLFEEAKLWFLAHETDWPYSFECICEVLDLDSDAVRARLGLARQPVRRSPLRASPQAALREPGRQSCGQA